MTSTGEKLIQLDNEYLWHPFTDMGRWLSQGSRGGRMIVEGDGFFLIDDKGGRYIDGFSSLWCNLHGHRVKKIDDAIRGQLGKIAHSTLLGHSSGPSAELAERLVRITPAGLDKVFYSDSGSSAVEVALKMAYQYYRNFQNCGQGRKRFLALRGGYHGDTLGSVSVGGIGQFHEIFSPLLFDVTLAGSPNSYVNPDGWQGVAERIDSLLGEAPNEYCAVIVEPLIQAAGGMLTHGQGFLANLRRITKERDVLLIADEVATGFCRTGKLFACEHEDVSPDLMTLGKGLTGGYLPVAATLATREIFDAFDNAEKTFYHGHTFTGNALGCAAANASIDLIFESGLGEQLPAKAEQIRSALSELANHPHVAEVRQCGMMVGIQLVRDRDTNQPFAPNLRVGTAVCEHALKHGVITRPLGDVLVLMPAPAMDETILGQLLEATVRTISEYFRQNAV